MILHVQDQTVTKLQPMTIFKLSLNFRDQKHIISIFGEKRRPNFFYI